MKTRGYDQAMLLAFATALELDDVAVETLEENGGQSGAVHASGCGERRANVVGAYEAIDRELIFQSGFCSLMML